MEESTLTLLGLEGQLNALRKETHERFEAMDAELKRRISHSDADKTVYSAIERRLEQIEKTLEQGFKTLLEDIRADRGGG